MVPRETVEMSHIKLLFLVLLSLSGSRLVAGHYYSIPNPFEPEQKAFYAISSNVFTANKTLDQLDYFSLAEGLTFTLIKEPSEEQPYAIIGDGPQGRTYIVSNPTADEEPDCELDHQHQHHHRLVFPFQYVYHALSPSSGKKKGKTRANKWFVYGIGAIWLNAIDLGTSSSSVGQDQQLSNVWHLHGDDYNVELAFQPIESPDSNAKPEEIQHMLDQTRPTSIQVKRTVNHMLNQPNGLVEDLIEVKSFERQVDANSDQMKRFLAQLNKCRQHTKSQRIFPSLLRAVSLSPDRLYHIAYLEQKFNSMKDNSPPDGSFEEKYHRNVHHLESHSEWFSFEKEMQVNVYQSVTEYPEPGDQTHVFMKNFTELEGQKNSRHATIQYHVIELDDSELVSCKRGEDDPAPDWLHLLLRPIHFRRPTGVVLTGQLTGMGALLMNAADIHYKKFSLHRRFISVLNNDSKMLTRMATDEWHLLDPGSKLLIQFYFKRKKKSRDSHSIDDLLRVEVRETVEGKTEKTLAKESGDSDDPSRDHNLLVRWNILEVRTQVAPEEKEFVFNKPEICETKEVDEFDKKRQQEEDEQDDELVNDPEEEWQFERDHYHNVPSDGEEEGSKNNHDSNKDLEMEEVVEDAQVPDFFDFMEGRRGYSLRSSVVLLKEAETRSKSVYLDERMDLSKNLLHLSVYTSNSPLVTNRASLEYYINYNARAMFEIDSKGGCRKVDQLESWLRILSSKVIYYRTNEQLNVRSEDDKLRMYGVAALWRRAAESEEETWFWGAKKEPTTDAGGRKYRELLWSLHEDEDYNMELKIKFWLKLDVDLKMRKLRAGFSERPLTLKSIELDNLMIEGDSYGGKFQRFRLDVGPFKTLDEPLKLPQQCQDLLKESAKEDYFTQVTFPTFETYINSSKAYTISYKVITAPTNVLLTTSNKDKVSETFIKESFDTTMNLGHLMIGQGEDAKEVFIDGSYKMIYLLSGRQCKRIISLKGLVDEDSNFITTNEDFSLEKMYGLAALWIRLQNLQHYLMTTVLLHDEAGDPYQRFVYETSDNFVGSDMKTVSIRVKAVFVMYNISQAQNRRFELESISFWPEHKNPDKHQKALHRTNIEVVSMSTDYSGANWKLPDECLSGDSLGPPAPLEGPKFPLWRDVIAVTEQFYARSEMTVSVPMLGEGKKIYLMDEWLFGGNLRFKSYGLRQNYDFLVYTRTREAFDISTEFRCSNELPKMDPSLYRSGNSLMEFWAFNRTFVNSLAELYYAPMSLWRLADANLENIKLVTSLNLAPKPTANQSKLDATERELREDTWQVSNPLATWSYDMHFERHSMVDPETKGLLEWYVLNRITVRDIESVTNILGLKREVDIDIINYRYHHDLNNRESIFLLPEGYGCRRSDEVEKELAKEAESLFLNTKMPHQISYEAALEKVTRSGDDDSELGPVVLSKTVLPTVMGTVFKSPSMHIWIDYATTRHLNGTKIANKIVYDKISSLTFEIDRLTGYCKIGHFDDRVWSLEFPDSENNSVQVVRLDEDLLQLLLNLQTSSSHLLNRFISNGRQVTVYEESLYKIKLTQQLEGPATIIRRFDHLWMGSGGRNTKLHRSLAIQVMLFDAARKNLEAVLNLNIKQAGNVALNNFIQAIDVSSCYNDGDGKTDISLRTFAIEYQCSTPKREAYLLDGASVEESFIASFLDSAQILPTQLVGSPRMTFNHDQSLISFTFSLLSAPTSIELDSQFDLGKRMSPQLEALAEVTLTPSLWDCSRWCDEVGCLALSYCNDHTCRVWSNFDVPHMESNPMNMSIMTEVDDFNCIYLRLLGKRPVSLDKFAGIMESSINSFHADSSEFKSLYKLATGRYCQTLTPRRFYEISDNFEPASSDDQHEHSAESYKIVGQNQRLKVPLSSETKSFKLTLEHVLSYSQCLATCSRINCLLLSYCSSDKSCSAIAGSGDLRLLKEQLKETTTDEMGCSISVRDLLIKYTAFEPTREPASYDRKLEGYSDLDCAAMCDAAREPTCLSFDVCSKADGKPTCYLQRQHIIQDSFDKSILMPDSGSSHKVGDNDGAVACKHYSKSILADYKQMINRQLLVAKDEQLVRVNSAEKCAHECREDQKCYGFEHCFDRKSKPAQSCQYVRSNDNFKPDTLSHLYKYLQDQSASSDKCSIYVLRHFPEEYTFDSEGPVAWVDNTRGILEHSGTQVAPRLPYIVRIMYYVMGSIVVGLLIQFAYIKALGRPLTYRP